MGLKGGHFREDHGMAPRSPCPSPTLFWVRIKVAKEGGGGESIFMTFMRGVSIIKSSIRPRGANTKVKTQMQSKLLRGAILGRYKS